MRILTSTLALTLSLAALLLTAGSLADLFGRRLVFVVGAALFMVGSVACGAAQDVLFLQLARAFQGIGGAAMFATALALIASAAELDAIAAGARDLPALSGWRAEVFGDDALRLAQGRIALSASGGAIKVVPVP